MRALRAEVTDDAALDGETRDEPHAWSDPVLAALATLAPEQRAVVVLRHLLEYTPGEIAGMLEVPRGTVNSRLRRGLDALRPLLEDEDR
jgi:RNA polymerase sigma-70 factor (ECF subfamily)